MYNETKFMKPYPQELKISELRDKRIGDMADLESWLRFVDYFS